MEAVSVGRVDSKVESDGYYYTDQYNLPISQQLCLSSVNSMGGRSFSILHLISGGFLLYEMLIG